VTELTDDEAAELLREMLAIPSPSGQEQELAAFLAGRAGKLGFTERLDEVGNLIAEIGTGDGPVIMLLSHLDTAAHQLPVRAERGWLCGRGAVDAKGPLAAMICAAARRPGFPGRIQVVAAVEEERLSRGGHHVARTMPPPDRLIVGEPSGWAGVALGYKGKIDLRYRVTRTSTHSTNPQPKAAEIAVGFWQALCAALGPGLSHAAFGRPAATLRGVQGDLVQAWVDVDCRVPPGFSLEQFTAALRAAAGDGELDIIRYIPAVRQPRANPAARPLFAAIRRHGGQPRPLLKTGTSDMNTVAERWSVPMAAYGPGDSTMDHGPDERISVEEYLRAIAVLTTALDEMAAEAGPPPVS
jgi:[amino group carrier protein]-lysine/ornithine hydrolase